MCLALTECIWALLAACLRQSWSWPVHHAWADSDLQVLVRIVSSLLWQIKMSVAQMFYLQPVSKSNLCPVTSLDFTWFTNISGLCWLNKRTQEERLNAEIVFNLSCIFKIFKVILSAFLARGWFCETLCKLHSFSKIAVIVRNLVYYEYLVILNAWKYSCLFLLAVGRNAFRPSIFFYETLEPTTIWSWWNMQLG